MIDEIEAKIQETIETNEDEQQVVRKAQASQATKSSTKSKGNILFTIKCISYISIHLKTAKKKKTVTESDEENDEPSEDSDSDLPHPAHVDKSPRKIAQKPHEKSSRRKNIFESNSSDVDSIDEEEAFKPPPKLQQSKSQANKTSTKNKGTFEV